VRYGRDEQSDRPTRLRSSRRKPAEPGLSANCISMEL
jgi:hypothetical protein